MRAVITGAAGGLGTEFLRQLAAPGTELIAADVNLDAARLAADRARALGAKVTVMECDVSAEGDVRALAALAAEKWGAVDLLVNNAAIFVGGPILEVDGSTVARAMSVNIGAIHLMCQQFAGLLGDGSRIINVTSLAGTFQLPQAGVYAASKAAATALSEGLAHELAPRGITVTTVCPSFIRTGFVEAGSGPRDVTQMSEPMFRWLGADADHVVESALRASRRGRHTDVPALHGRLALMLQRLAPHLTRRAIGASYRLFGD